MKQIFPWLLQREYVPANILISDLKIPEPYKKGTIYKLISIVLSNPDYATFFGSLGKEYSP